MADDRNYEENRPLKWLTNVKEKIPKKRVLSKNFVWAWSKRLLRFRLRYTILTIVFLLYIYDRNQIIEFCQRHDFIVYPSYMYV